MTTEWTYNCRDCGCAVRPSSDPNKALECVTCERIAELEAENTTLRREREAADTIAISESEAGQRLRAERDAAVAESLALKGDVSAAASLLWANQHRDIPDWVEAEATRQQKRDEVFSWIQRDVAMYGFVSATTIVAIAALPEPPER